MKKQDVNIDSLTVIVYNVTILFLFAVPLMLDECLEYLNRRSKNGCTYEIIIVSDGSTDDTVKIAHKYALKHENIRVLELVKNRGKGGAVRLVSNE